MHSQTLPEAWSDSTHVLADRLLIKNWPATLPWEPVVPDTLAKEGHLLPVVLRIDQLDAEQKELLQQHLSVKLGSGLTSAILIGSHLSARGMAHQIAGHVLITLADDTRALLRLADPHVFVHLLWILPLPHLASLCAGTNRWSVPFQGAWHELQFSDRPEPKWDSLPEASSIALANVGLINEVLATLPAPAGLTELWRVGQQTNEWIGIAQAEFGLTGASDCVAFARHGVLLGKGFSVHPSLSPHLHAARKTPGLYAERTASLSQRDWNTLIADIEETNRKQEAS